MKRRTPDSFTCKGCGELVQRRPSPQRDIRTHYCSKACKVRHWFTERPAYAKAMNKPEPRKPQRLCAGGCGVMVPALRKRCSGCVRRLSSALSLKVYYDKRPTPTTTSCRECGAQVDRTQDARRKWFCSVACGKKHLRRRHRHSENNEARARRAGVPVDYSIKPLKVFERDGWRCQLCGVSTPQRLRGGTDPRSPEVDHIVPISMGGGHTWDNVQCACRRCNGIKGAKALGQMRITLCRSSILEDTVP